MQKNITRKSPRKCYLCSGTEHRSRAGKVRDDSSLEVFECTNCGLVFLSKTELSKQFYEQSGMHGDNPADATEWLHNLDRDDTRRLEYLDDAITNRNVLDFGCGPGGFLIRARAKAKTVTGVELEARLQPFFKKAGLNVFQQLADIPDKMEFDLITAFHVVEHLEDPAEVLKHLATRLRGGRIIIEIPSAEDALLTLYESKPFSEFTYWSCHLYLFNSCNLKLLAKKAGLVLDFIEHVQRYPLSNHLYWLSRGKPGGHKAWGFLDDEALSKAYAARLAALGRTDTLIAGFRNG